MELRILGPIEIVADGELVPLSAFKHRQLLAALAIGESRSCPTDELIDALWGEAPPPSAAKVLRIYVSQLRKVLPSPARVRTRNSGYVLELEAGALDAARFESLLEEGKAAARAGNPALAVSLLRRALGLWRGRAFGELAYETFARAAAERLEELRLIAVEERIEAELALGLHEDALPEVCRLAGEQPLRERLQGQAMLALYRCGRQSEALERYASFRTLLHDELGLEPGSELRDLQRRILQHDPGLVGPPMADAPATALPAPLNRLLGRTRELKELRDLLLRDEVRLLVLTGAGGSGKTRVALEAARQATDCFANGAAFVSLAPLRDSHLIIEAIARALRIDETPGETLLETIATALRSLELLLVLDNAEHLPGAGPILVELLAGAPRLTLLVTSRVVLHLTGEHVYPVEPLAAEPAIELFLERARASEPRFDPDETGSRAIRRICARLDRLPLAIELAATHIRTLAPVELLARLEPCLPLLTVGPRDLPARQQTLKATLDWSFDLLEEGQRRDLARLAVFSGGFTVEAADIVCGTPLERLSSLVDASLVQRVEAADEARFSMLETVREHALDLLGPERSTIELRHGLYFLELAETAEERFFGEQHAAVVTQLDADHDNLRVALDNLHREGRAAEELRLAAALWQHWSARGHPAEARRRLIDALAADLEDHPARVNALHGAALLSSRLGDLDAAEALAQEARRLARRLTDACGEGHALNTVGIASLLRGESDAAAPSFRKAARLFGQAGERRGYAIALLNLGVVEMNRRRWAASERFGREALEIFRELGDVSDQALILGNLSLVALERGAVERAEEHLRESLRLALEIRFTERIANALVGLAAVAASRGENAEAASRLGAAGALRDDAGYVPEGPETALHERTKAHARSALGVDRYDDLVGQARSRPWEIVAQV